MRTIATRRRTVEIPATVAELTSEQYEYYCFLAYALGSGTITPEYFRTRWFSYLIGMGKADYTLLKPEFITELDSQISAVDGFFIRTTVGAEQREHLDFSCVANLLPYYRGYHGPGDMLHGVTFGEFTECLTELESLGSADEQGVAQGYEHIARVLYHIPEAEAVPYLLSFHAPTLFASVWRAIQSEPIEINGKKIDFRIIFKSMGSPKPDDKTGWTGITFEVAAAGVFGNVNEVEATDMWAILIYLYKCKFEYINEKHKS